VTRQRDIKIAVATKKIYSVPNSDPKRELRDPLSKYYQYPSQNPRQLVARKAGKMFFVFAKCFQQLASQPDTVIAH